MPTWKSIHGKWVPADEEVGLKNLGEETMEVGGKKIPPGKPFVYEGKDRVALDILKKEGLEHLGVDFRTDPEFRQAVRNQGFDTVEDYLKSIGFDEEKDKAEQVERTKDVKAHAEPKKKKETIISGGGKDTSGNKENDLVGGFGSERTRKPSEIK